MSLAGFDAFGDRLRQLSADWLDRRTGSNIRYRMTDIALSAFSVFFTQCPSFLAHQKAMQKAKGENNAQSLFGIQEIPCDNHIREMLDPVSPQALYPLYEEVYESLKQKGVLEAYRTLQDTTLIALDGTWYFSSKKVHCKNCSCIEHQNGETTYYHSAITPVIVAPDQPHPIALAPEFITPQDGHKKQDCEIAAAKRWLEANAPFCQDLKSTLLGDDLYAHQPFCRRVLLHGLHFVFVCKPDSHKALYEWVDPLESGIDKHTLTLRVKNRGHWEIHTYAYANGAPLREGADALEVNWCEVKITSSRGKLLYHNAFITDFEITDRNVAPIVAAGRARWKIENENNNTLKTKGYHLEHNFGHGKEHLSSLLAAMNILAFLVHTFLAFLDGSYQLVRAALPTRKTFFEDLRALTRYICFPSWESLLEFMMRGLEIGPHAQEA